MTITTREEYESTAAAVAAVTAAPPAPARPSRFKRLMRRFNGLFLVTVLLPTLASAVYFGWYASGVYVSESRFLVRNPQRPQQTGLGALLQGTAFARSQDDTYAVHDFIQSRDSLRAIDEKIGFRVPYSDPAIDVLNRFPVIDPDDSFEALHRHYQKYVLVSYDTVSSISTLRIRAFTAEQAKRINEQLLEMSERLVNGMNMRSRRDLIEVAEKEVALAEARSRETAAALSSFRAGRSVFDPNAQGALQLQAVAQLQAELVAAEAQLAQVQQVSPNNPQIASLESRVSGLRKAIADENARVLGRNGGLVSKSPAFDRLVLEKGFADRQLATAMAALDGARAEAQRKQLYLERLVEPNLPDRDVEPRRIRAILTTFVLGLVLWGILSLVVSGVREHAD